MAAPPTINMSATTPLRSRRSPRAVNARSSSARPSRHAAGSRSRRFQVPGGQVDTMLAECSRRSYQGVSSFWILSSAGNHGCCRTRNSAHCGGARSGRARRCSASAASNTSHRSSPVERAHPAAAMAARHPAPTGTPPRFRHAFHLVSYHRPLVTGVSEIGYGHGTVAGQDTSSVLGCQACFEDTVPSCARPALPSWKFGCLGGSGIFIEPLVLRSLGCGSETQDPGAHTPRRGPAAPRRRACTS